MRIEAPRITGPALADLEEAEPAAALDPAGTDGCRIEGAALDGVKRTGVTYRDTEFVRATAASARFGGCRFLDVRLDGWDAPDLAASGSTWRQVEISQSRMGTLALDDSTMSGVRIDQCKVGFLGLQGAEVHDLLVEHCSIDELDLTDAIASRVAFRETRINQLSLRGARLSHVDLRGARLDRVDAMPGLRGAVITLEQLLDLAPSLAAELGILVE